jgi:hypothetical protein
LEVVGKDKGLRYNFNYRTAVHGCVNCPEQQAGVVLVRFDSIWTGAIAAADQ